MSKRMLWAGVFLALIIFPAILKAQQTEEKIPLAVLPFVLSPGAVMGNPADVTTIQEIVTTEFTQKERFTVLDRSKFQKIIDELKIQTMDQFLNSKVVAQGKQIGAKYLVAGIVNEYKTTRNEKQAPKNPLKPFGDTKMVMTYPASLKMSFGVIEVETGKLLFNNPINVVSNDIYSGDSLASSKKALSNMQDEVRVQIRNILSGALKILGIDKTGKDGVATTVLTNGGGVIFTDKDKGAKLGVYTSTNVGGLVRESQIGEMKVSKIESQVVVCEIRNGAKEIDAAIKANTPLIVKIIKK